MAGYRLTPSLHLVGRLAGGAAPSLLNARSSHQYRIDGRAWGRGRTHGYVTGLGSRGCIVAKASKGDVEKTTPSLEFGEDAAAFELSEQNVTSWALFFTLLTGVLGLIYVLWIDPSYGVGSSFTGLIESLAPTSEIAILEILFVFAVVHSGLAYLRPYGEDLVGARAYRVMFALISLPLAIAAVVFFINHRMME
eukprot:jgi/Picre1/35105/NNA_002568.t1